MNNFYPPPPLLKKTTAAVFLFFMLCANAFALNLDNDFYSNFSRFLREIYGTDYNSGMTVFPVLGIPSGGKAEGMAGAFSAVCDDVSFLEWNPAGSAEVPNSEIGFFHNNWIADIKIETALYSRRIKDFGFGFLAKWLYTTFTEYDDFGEHASKGYYSEALAILNTSYTFLKGYYFPGISLGVNLKGAFRISPDVTGYDSSSQSSTAVLGDVGLLTRINFLKFYWAREKNMSFALVLRNLGVIAEKGKPSDEVLPALAVAGFSYKPFRQLCLSFDFSYPVNLNNIYVSESFYFSTGLAVSITNFISMRAGILIQAGSSRIVIGSGVNLKGIAFDINYTVDLVTQFQTVNRLTLGVRFNFGDGGRKERDKLVDKYYDLGLDAYSEYKDDIAIEYFNKALALNRYFDPAEEAIDAIKAFRKITTRIKTMDKLEY